MKSLAANVVPLLRLAVSVPGSFASLLWLCRGRPLSLGPAADRHPDPAEQPPAARESPANSSPKTAEPVLRNPTATRTIPNRSRARAPGSSSFPGQFADLGKQVRDVDPVAGPLDEVGVDSAGDLVDLRDAVAGVARADDLEDVL